MIYARRLLLLIVGLVPVAGAWAVDRADLEGTSIIGNRELPRGPNLVPWRSPPLLDTANLRPPIPVVTEIVEPIDPEIFRRRLP